MYWVSFAIFALFEFYTYFILSWWVSPTVYPTRP
jgi:hypothetical protein